MILNIGKTFSPEPSGRRKEDGVGASAEEFRENHLKPNLDSLNENEKLTIILDDNVLGYSAAFLEESFAQLVLCGYMTSSELLSKLRFRYKDEDFKFYETKIKQYIENAGSSFKQVGT